MTSRSLRHDARAALARDLVALGHVDDVNGAVGQLRRERRREVVAARFDDDDLQIGELLFQLGDGGQVDAGVLADGAVRTAAGLDADDAFQRQRLPAGEELGVLARVDVVGDDGQVELRPELRHSRFDQRRLAGADRTADAEREHLTPRSGVGRRAAAVIVIAVCLGPMAEAGVARCHRDDRQERNSRV